MELNQVFDREALKAYLQSLGFNPEDAPEHLKTEALNIGREDLLSSIMTILVGDLATLHAVVRAIQRQCSQCERDGAGKLVTCCEVCRDGARKLSQSNTNAVTIAMACYLATAPGGRYETESRDAMLVSALSQADTGNPQ